MCSTNRRQSNCHLPPTKKSKLGKMSKRPGDALSGENEVRDAVPYGVRQQTRLLSINSTLHDIQGVRRSMDAWYLLGSGGSLAGCSTTF